jgi:hypothetical protein
MDTSKDLLKSIENQKKVKVSRHIYSLIDRSIDEKCDRLIKNKKNSQNRTTSIIEHTKRKLSP